MRTKRPAWGMDQKLQVTVGRLRSENRKRSLNIDSVVDSLCECWPEMKRIRRGILRKRVQDFLSDNIVSSPLILQNDTKPENGCYSYLQRQNIRSLPRGICKNSVITRSGVMPVTDNDHQESRNDPLVLKCAGHLNYSADKVDICAVTQDSSSTDFSISTACHTYSTERIPKGDAAVGAQESLTSCSRKRHLSLSKDQRSKNEAKRRAVADALVTGGKEDLNERPGRKFMTQPPKVMALNTLVGIDHIVEDIESYVLLPMVHPEVFQHFNEPSGGTSGVLIIGAPGSGKTTLAFSIASKAGVCFFKIVGPEIINGMSGESEKILKSVFDEAKASQPSIILIDEIDAICPKKDNSGKEMERRIVTQLASCMDDIEASSVVVLATTSRPDALDATIRRNGRFDRELVLAVPTTLQREQILKVICHDLPLCNTNPPDFGYIAHLATGYFPADLWALKRSAIVMAAKQLINSVKKDHSGKFSDEQLQILGRVSHCHFIDAFVGLKPTAAREGLASSPNVKWETVGALKMQKTFLIERVCAPMKHYALFEQLGLDVPAGIIFWGPQGCGKTLLAKAVATEIQASFISVKGPELLSKYVGDSEKAIRELFSRAHAVAPCVIFFDEFDALCPCRGSGGSAVSDRVVNQMLSELDGIQKRKHVQVLAATNRPDLIDKAILRSGRFQHHLYVPVPSREERLDILRRITLSKPLDADVDLSKITDSTERYNGADLAALVVEATYLALECVIGKANLSSTLVEARSETCGEVIVDNTLSTACNMNIQKGPLSSEDVSRSNSVVGTTTQFDVFGGPSDSSIQRREIGTLEETAAVNGNGCYRENSVAVNDLKNISSNALKEWLAVKEVGEQLLPNFTASSKSPIRIEMSHFLKALTRIFASVSVVQQESYEELRKTWEAR